MDKQQLLALADVNALAKEIGADPLGRIDPEAFGEEWCRRLAAVVEKLGWLPTYAYPKQVLGWCHSIKVASKGNMRLELRRIRQEISGIDYDDGWANDPAGSAVENICLAMQPDSRWLAHAGKLVWRFAVGGGSYNDVVLFSEAAWLREQFARTAAALRSMGEG